MRVTLSPNFNLNYKMKKVVLTIFAAIVCIAANAQTPSFGIKGGLNLAQFTASASAGGADVSISSKNLSTFNVGVFADVKIPASNFSIRPELNYMGQGGKFSDVETSDGVTQSAVATEKLYYLQLPVNVLYHAPIPVGDLYFGAGPYAALGLSGTVSATTNDGQGNVESQSSNVHFGNSSSDDVKSTQFGVNFVAGFKLPNGLLINLDYNLGLSNDAPGSGDPETGSGSVKSKVFSISLGYAIK